jgi:hypothetical protein
MSHEGLVVRLVFFEIERDDALASNDDDLLDAPGERQGLGPAATFLVGVGGLLDRDLVLLKEPLSLGARGSALAVIHPVDGHARLSVT